MADKRMLKLAEDEYSERTQRPDKKIVELARPNHAFEAFHRRPEEQGADCIRKQVQIVQKNDFPPDCFWTAFRKS